MKTGWIWPYSSNSDCWNGGDGAWSGKDGSEPEGTRRWIMQDLVYVLVTIAFFVVSIAYVHFCERVK